MKTFFAVVLTAVLVGTASMLVAQNDEVPQPSELIVEVGHAYFKQYCASCHGKDALGDGPSAPALKTPPPDLTRIAARRKGVFNSAEVAAIIDGRTQVAAHGSGVMPVWGRRFSEESGDDSIGDEIVRGRLLILVEYLRSVQR